MCIYFSIMILYINVLVFLSVMLLVKLNYFFRCLILLLWVIEFHKNVQEGGYIKSKDIVRRRTEQQHRLCYPRES